MLALVYPQGLLAQRYGVVEDYGFNGGGEVFLLMSQATIEQLQVLQRDGAYGCQKPLQVAVVAVFSRGQLQRIPPFFVEVVVRDIARVAVPNGKGFRKHPDWRVSGIVQTMPDTAIKAIGVGDQVILYIHTDQATGRPKNGFLARDRETLPIVFKWTGAEIRLLREAMRLTHRDFAEHIEVSSRLLSKWVAGDVPRFYYQQLLDSCLVTAGPDAQRRFEQALREAASTTPD